MPARITLSVTQGTLPQPEYLFAERTTCVIGREEDCDPRVPNDKEHRSISRMHCMFDINPPDVHVCDMASKYGTFLNGTNIGQRETEEQRGKPLPEHALKDGDEVRLGNPAVGKSITFRVGVFVPTCCNTCAAEIPEAEKAAAQKSMGIFQCAGCREKAARQAEPLRKKARTCPRCGRDVSAEMGENRQGDFICAACKADPLALVSRLLDLARTGKKDLLAIQGYRIERELGKGGMGAAYLARHEKSGAQVALKVMLPEVAADQAATDRFQREADLTRSLRHRNIVRLHDCGCSQGTFFFTLEFCEGGSVAQLMAQQCGTLSVDEAAGITLQALAGLEYAHQAEVTSRLADGSTQTSRGLVHRDLSPQNLFLTGQENSRVVKVGDFGLAKAYDQAGLTNRTRTGTAAGKPCFIPRQQVVNYKYAGADVDVWAMAACFYNMVTGEFPRDFPED
jgi:serine/threonine-protein kinase